MTLCPSCGRTASEREGLDREANIEEPYEDAIHRCVDPIHDAADRWAEERAALIEILRWAVTHATNYVSGAYLHDHDEPCTCDQCAMSNKARAALARLNGERA